MNQVTSIMTGSLIKTLTYSFRVSKMRDMLNEVTVIGRRAIDIGKLRYCVLPGKYGSLINRSLYNKMFEFWKKQWEPLVVSISDTPQLHSDEFLRQFEITALIYDDQVIGVMGIDIFDFGNPAHMDHSYFSWLDEKDYAVFKDFGVAFIINNQAVN
jgi:hypothetical protein